MLCPTEVKKASAAAKEAAKLHPNDTIKALRLIRSRANVSLRVAQAFLRTALASLRSAD